MRVSQATVYGIKALLQLSHDQNKPPISAATLAGDLMPAHFLSQILKQLADAGLVTAWRGVAGGSRLAKPLSQITLIDVMEATDGVQVIECAELSVFTTAQRRDVQEAVRKATQVASVELSKVKLSQLK